MMNIDSNKYTVIDLDKEWGHIRSVMNDVTDDILVDALCGAVYMPDPWSLDAALHGAAVAPWEMTNSTWWPVAVDQAIDDGCEAGEEHALETREAENKWYRLQEEGTSRADVDEAITAYYALYEYYHPTPESAQWWFPKHRCNDVAPWALALAQLAYPDGHWRLLEGEMHTTVIDTRLLRVFDVMIYDSTTDPIEFALRDAPPETK